MPISKFEYRRPLRSLLWIAAATLVLCPVAADRSSAQSAPDTENGRYTLSPVAGDFLRLDTRTGIVSTCSNKIGWVCSVAPDERSALDSEIGRLQAENQKLKDQLTQRNPTGAQTPDGGKKATGATDNFEQLRSDNQKLLAMIDRVWERLIEMAGKIQKKLSEKI